MKNLDRHAATGNEGRKREDVDLDALELIALEQYYLTEQDRMTQELKDLEDRLKKRATSLEALEVRLTQGLNAVHALEARLAETLTLLQLDEREQGNPATDLG